MFDFLQKLSAISEDALQKKFGESTSVHFDVSFEEGRGDCTTSCALQYSKKVSLSPKEIASFLAETLSRIPDVQSATVAGPGFVNVTLSTATLLRGIAAAAAACVPSPTRSSEPPVIVEYCSLNIAKPFGVHHILVTMIGQAVANLYHHHGANVLRWNYYGDWGTQFGKLYVAFISWGKQSLESLTLDHLFELYVKFHDEAEKDDTLLQRGQDAFQRLERGDAEVRQFWEACVVATKRAVAPVLKRLSVAFDSERGESHYEHAMSPILEEGKKKGVFVEGDRGALIVRFPEASNLPPAVVLKSDGATNYLTRDLALVRDRVSTYRPSAIYHVVGSEQSLHFRQLMETARMLQWELPAHWEHLSFGRMRFADQGMSTRKGNVLKLEDVMNQAVARAKTLIAERGDKIQTDDPDALAEMMGVGALVYGILSQNRKMDMVFDWGKMLTFEGNSAPYLQYTYARARSVLRKAGAQESLSPDNVANLSSHERTLLKSLALFGPVLDEARTEHLPHKLATYLYELCQSFNAFYNADDILTATGATKDLRLSLTSAFARVLKTGAQILTLRVPERM